MSPTHANKKGVRYRYYTSHALLQRRKEHAGSVPRVGAPEVEALVCQTLRRENSAADDISDKELIAQRVSKVIIRRDRIEVELPSNPNEEEPGSAKKLVIPFAPTVAPQKGIALEPVYSGQIDAVAREKLLNAIRRACRWVEALRSGEVECFDEIAAHERMACATCGA
ncbi:MAG: site-specific recombinase [Chthoniobacter sp.]|nr:site-specific recombinase [Chthoniobacter sp.]